jgi:hypothetical protein
MKAQKVATLNLAGAAGTLSLGDGAIDTASLIVIQVEGSITATFTVQGTLDDVTWVSILARPIASTTAASTITAAGIYQIEASGWSRVRLSWSGSETGTPEIWRRPVVG